MLEFAPQIVPVLGTREVANRKTGWLYYISIADFKLGELEVAKIGRSLEIRYNDSHSQSALVGYFEIPEKIRVLLPLLTRRIDDDPEDADNGECADDGCERERVGCDCAEGRTPRQTADTSEMETDETANARVGAPR